MALYKFYPGVPVLVFSIELQLVLAKSLEIHEPAPGKKAMTTYALRKKRVPK